MKKTKKDDLMDKSILKEVFMVKLASVLGVGPKFMSCYGYDLILADNKIEFLTEQC